MVSPRPLATIPRGAEGGEVVASTWGGAGGGGSALLGSPEVFPRRPTIAEVLRCFRNTSVEMQGEVSQSWLL